jgi:hypothetical protein
MADSRYQRADESVELDIAPRSSIALPDVQML